MNSFNKVCIIFASNLLLIIGTSFPVYSHNANVPNSEATIIASGDFNTEGVAVIYPNKHSERFRIEPESGDNTGRKNFKSLELKNIFDHFLLVNEPCITDIIPPIAICRPVTVTLDENRIGNVFARNALFSEGFESYNNAFPIAWPHSSSWFTWDGNQSQSSLVTTEKSYSGSNSLKVGSSLSEDFLFSLGDKTSGKYFLRWKMFIPSGKSFHFNMQNSTNPGELWNFQVEFRNDYLTQNPVFLGDGNAKFFDLNLEVFPFNYPTDTWFDIFFYFDLDEDIAKVFINDSKVFEGYFPLNLGAINIFSPFGAASGYLDDIEYVTLPVNNPIDGGSSDNCNLMGMFSSPASFDCSKLGANPVTLTVVDVAGNISICTTVVTVKSKNPPIPVCKNTVVELDSSGNYKLLFADVLDNSEENCITYNLQNLSPSYVSCSDIGKSVPVTVTVNDSKGNTSTCLATITAKDNSPPAVTCKPFTTQLNVLGFATINPVDVFLKGSDNCDTVIFHSVTPETFSCNDVGINTVTLTVNDKSGNTAKCQTIVTVQDKISPIVQCKAHTLVLHPNGVASISPNDIYLSHTDNCNEITILGLSRYNFDCADVNSPQSVTLSVKDLSGNIASCTSLVTIVDMTPPEINCRNITVQIDSSGLYSLKAQSILFNQSEACGISTVILSKTQFTCKEVGPNNVQLKVTDVNGNSSSCLAIVSVIGNPALDNGAAEICDGIDNNCNGQIDEGFDIDGDGYTTCSGDCDDSDSAIHPGATEICDGKDNNCNGLIDEGVTPAWYADLDGDGYGDPAKQILACIKPAGYVSDNTDCMDSNAEINPGKSEICDGLDNDCDGIVDNGIGPVWYEDNDGDGFGNAAKFAQACTAPLGYVSNNTDCNDLNAAVFPGATEVCNGQDDDCDGLIDEGLEKEWYADADMDGYGNPAVTVLTCAAPVGYVGNKSDCNDANAAVNPAAVEVCNGKDDDCNGLIDDGISGVVYVGNKSFISQAQIASWSPCFDVIQGNLYIMGFGITDLTPLGNLTKVTGDVVIKISSMTNLNGLNALRTIGRDLEIQNNGQLTTLQGLNALSSVGRNLGIFYNQRLTDCCPVFTLLNSGGVAVAKSIFGNKTSCENLNKILTICPGGAMKISATGNNTGAGTRLPGQGLEHRLTLFPNPATEKVYVHFDEVFMEGSVKVFDINGRLQMSEDLEGQKRQYELKTGNLPPGIYFLRAMIDGENFALRLVVETSD